jgi:plasmid stability protein
MVTLNIDDETFAAWRERAAAEGLSVEEWLKVKIDDETEPSEPVRKKRISDEEWRARLQAIADSHRPTGAPLDDSRDSIYD